MGSKVLVGGVFVFSEGEVVSHACTGSAVTPGTPCVVVNDGTGTQDTAVGLLHPLVTTDDFMVQDVFICASKKSPANTVNNFWQACMVKQLDGETWCQRLGKKDDFPSCADMRLVRPNETSRGAIVEAFADEG